MEVAPESKRLLDGIVVLDKKKKPLYYKFYVNKPPQRDPFIADLVVRSKDILSNKNIQLMSYGNYMVAMKKLDKLSFFFLGNEDANPVLLCHAFSKYLTNIRVYIGSEEEESLTEDDILDNYTAFILITDELICDGYLVDETDTIDILSELEEKPEGIIGTNAFQTAISGVKLIGKSLLN